MNFAYMIFASAAFQALMVWKNLGCYTTLAADESSQEKPPSLSVLIPARNEVLNLTPLLTSLSTQQDCEFEVVILDDDSQDGTWEVARSFSESDPRFAVYKGLPLPYGWAGKPFACQQLSELARFDQWLFVDADVVFTSKTALSSISRRIGQSRSALLSSVPRQITATWAEHLVIPLIHLVLLGFLPFWEMRRNRMPALGAACGQLLGVKAQQYLECGGHEAIRHRLHDATALAAAFRKKGHLTDLFDSTALAQCRMYRTFGEVWSGFSKNATEGMAQPFLLPIWTLLLGTANILPWLYGVAGNLPWPVLGAQLLNVWVNLVLMRRFKQSGWGAFFRPAGVLLFLTIQWVALLGKTVGWKTSWKGRVYHRLHS